MTARGSYGSELLSALSDFRASFDGSRVWRVLAVNDILGRYRGSLIGPFWITLTQGAFILGIGLLYSQLFRISTKDYVPLLANGVIIWTLFQQIIIDGCETFIGGATLIKQTALPLPSFLWRVIARNLIVFGHHSLVLLVVSIIFGYTLQIEIWWAVLGIAVSVANVAWMGLLCGLICTRFRDMPQVIFALMQMLFFLTPVLWDPKQAPRAATLLSLNPFYHMLLVTREPLLGRGMPFGSLGVLVILALVGWTIAFSVFAAVRRRVVHYL